MAAADDLSEADLIAVGVSIGAQLTFCRLVRLLERKGIISSAELGDDLRGLAEFYRLEGGAEIAVHFLDGIINGMKLQQDTPAPGRPPGRLRVVGGKDT